MGMIIFYFSKFKVKQFVLMHLHQQEIRFQELLNKVKSIFCPAFRIKIINLPLKKLQNNINLDNCIWWWTYSKFFNFLNPTVIIIWIWMNLISLVENYLAEMAILHWWILATWKTEWLQYSELLIKCKQNSASNYKFKLKYVWYQNAQKIKMQQL